MVKERLQEIFRDVFDDDSIELFDEMTSEDVEDWDSLSHMTLIGEIERVFAIELTTDEILKAKNVGEFIRVIEKRNERFFNQRSEGWHGGTVCGPVHRM